MLVGNEVIVANSAIRASLAIHRDIDYKCINIESIEIGN